MFSAIREVKRVRLGGGWLLFAVCALVAGACTTDVTVATGSATTTTTTTHAPSTGVVSSSTTRTGGTTPTLDSSPWSRVPHDESVFGGAGHQQMWSVSRGELGLVAVGWDGSGGDFDAAVWTSPDGVVWTRVPHDEEVFGGAQDQVMRIVIEGGPGLVAVAGDESGGNFDAAVWTSPDGIVWTRVPHDEEVFGGAGFQEILSVTIGGPGLVAVGLDESGGDRDAAVWTSPNGVVWTRVPHDEVLLGGTGHQNMFSVAVAGPGLVAVGVDGSGGDRDAAVWTSSDGVTWNRVQDDGTVLGGAGDQEMMSVTVGGPGLVAVGSDGSGNDFDAAVWTSSDGVVWTRVSHDEAVFGGPGIQAMVTVTEGGPGLVAVGVDGPGGEDAAIWTSSDGFAWTRVPHDEAVFGGPGNQMMLGVTVGESGLVVVGRDDLEGDRDAAVWVLED